MMAPVDRCQNCNASLGSLTQSRIPGTDREVLCHGCETNERTKWMLDAATDAADELSDWELEFLDSIAVRVRVQGRALTENQYQKLEQIYEKVGR